MKAKDLFGLAVRLIGLVFLYQALASIPMALTSVFPNFTYFYPRNILPSLITVGWPLALAFGLIRGAGFIIRFAYGEEPLANSGPPAPQVPAGTERNF